MMHKEAALILCILYTSVREEESPGGEPGRRGSGNQETAGRNISFTGGNIGAVDGVAQLFNLLFAAGKIAGAALAENEAVSFGRVQPASYTQLTLPTKRRREHLWVGGPLKKKKTNTRLVQACIEARRVGHAASLV